MALATGNAELVLQKIKELPPLPLVVQKLVKVMDDDRSSAGDISKVLSSDQAMASKVLKLVNSSFYGLSGTVSTISRAVVILGVAAIRNLALGLSVARIMTRGQAGDLQGRFWAHSLAAAAAAETLARAGGYPDPEEAYIAGLLHDIGHLVFLMALPEEFLDLMNGDLDQLQVREKEVMGLGHAQAGQKLLKHWKLPRHLEQAVRFHHTGSVITSAEDPLASIVAMADTLAGAHGSRYESSLDDGDFLALVKVTALDLDTLGGMLDAIEKRVAETCLFLKVATDGDLEMPAQAASRSRNIVLICTDPVKARWSQQLLGHFGHRLLPMKQFFADAASGTLPDQVILDPGSVTAEQLARMAPLLKEVRDRLVLLGNDREGGVAAAVGGPVARLPLGFSRDDLVFAD